MLLLLLLVVIGDVGAGGADAVAVGGNVGDDNVKCQMSLCPMVWKCQMSLCVLQAAADAAVASSRQSFIDEYFGGEFETTYLFLYNKRVYW